MSSKLSGSAEEWKRGWKLVLACFVGFAFFSLMSSSIGVFMVPLGRDFGWSRTLWSAGVAIASTTTALLSPLFGMLIDRFGPRKVALPGLVATTIAVSAFSLTNGSPMQWLALWTFYAVISISVKTTVWTTAVAGSFRSAQGLALGLTLSGTAASQAVAPPLATWLIAEVGWRTTYLWLGCGWGSVALALCYLFLFDARDQAAGLAKAEPGAIPPLPLRGLTPGQALHSFALQRVLLATLLMITLTIGLLIHQIEILTAAALPPSTPPGSPVSRASSASC